MPLKICKNPNFSKKTLKNSSLRRLNSVFKTYFSFCQFYFSQNENFIFFDQTVSENKTESMSFFFGRSITENRKILFGFFLKIFRSVENDFRKSIWKKFTHRMQITFAKRLSQKKWIFHFAVFSFDKRKTLNKIVRLEAIKTLNFSFF